MKLNASLKKKIASRESTFEDNWEPARETPPPTLRSRITASRVRVVSAVSPGVAKKGVAGNIEDRG